MTLTRRGVLGRGLALAASSAAAVAVPGPVPMVRPSGPPALPQPTEALQLPAATAEGLAATALQVQQALRMPFTLGVASGEPTHDGVVLWTRLAPAPLDPDGFGGMPDRDVPVHWQAADDPGFRRIVRAGTVVAQRRSAHSVHVELTGLRPASEVFYRFRAGRHLSPTGRTRTSPAPGALAPLTFAVTSCAHYEHGWFTAYRHLADARPDLVLSLGDYLYEPSPRVYTADSGTVRSHVGGRATTLADFRQRHAQYKTDPDLQAAHGAAPWAVTYDDHEIRNNWAAGVAARPFDQGSFGRVRAAAMKAYYEHMPLRRSNLPRSARMQMFRRLSWGGLATFHILDTRQYRDDQACGDGLKPRCPQRHAPRRSLLGRHQEAWLAHGLRTSRAGWDFLAQQVFFAPNYFLDSRWGTGRNMDSWDGYPSARERLLDAVSSARVRNFTVLTGDWHSHWAAEILRRFSELGASPLGVELVTSSVTSDGDGQAQPKWGLDSLAAQPYLRHFDQRRGFVLVDVTTDRMRADFRVVDYVSRPAAAARSSGAFVVEDGAARLHRN